MSKPPKLLGSTLVEVNRIGLVTSSSIQRTMRPAG
jgi:hypothetical protein